MPITDRLYLWYAEELVRRDIDVDLTVSAREALDEIERITGGVAPVSN